MQGAELAQFGAKYITVRFYPEGKGRRTLELMAWESWQAYAQSLTMGGVAQWSLKRILLALLACWFVFKLVLVSIYSL